MNPVWRFMARGPGASGALQESSAAGWHAMPPTTNRLNTQEVNPVSSISDAAVAIGEQAVEASTPFVGQWNTLVSTTNWEKGQIICQWRSELEKSGADQAEYSDEAWAQLVGGVTGQHVGRLRRVHQRFGEVYSEYPGLYWSHFQAASDWDDAEMWLEGALQNDWSISQMRGQRWEAVGTGEPEPPASSAIVDSEMVDVEGYGDDAAAQEQAEDSAGESESHSSSGSDGPSESAPAANRETATEGEAPRERSKPFKDLPDLPEDLAEAFEQFKLAILAHKLTDWNEISREDVVGALEALKQLAYAESE